MVKKNLLFKAFLTWAWKNKDGQALMEEFQEGPEKLRPT